MTHDEALAKAEEAERRAHQWGRATHPDSLAWLRMRDRWLEKAAELEERDLAVSKFTMDFPSREQIAVRLSKIVR